MGPLLWAVHISDGILTLPWLAGGFALAALLAVWGAFRLRDEEIPRIALLSAAFFAASLLHVRLGPTSAHLLLNGLVGLVLGRRAALAIPLGLFLQAVLFPGHGGFTTLGVNACVLTLPALLAGWTFAALHRLPWLRRPGFRTLLVAAGSLVCTLGGVFLVAVIATNRWTELRAVNLDPAREVVCHPIALSAAALAALGAARGERRLKAAPEFALGFAVGATAVLATVTLNALVLLLGGGDDWHQIVVLVVLAHLPVVLLEGIVLGFAVGFLARVKPDLLGIETARDHREAPALEPSSNGIAAPQAPIAPDRTAVRPPAFLLALLTLAVTAGTARAHRLKADFVVLRGGKVQIESWYDVSRESPAGARVEVFGPNRQLLVAGKTDEKGLFVFEYGKAEPLRVVVSAGAGHRCEIDIPAEKLSASALIAAPEAAKPSSTDGTSATEGRSFADRRTDASGKDVLLGIAFLLALAAFVLSLRNARKVGWLCKSSFGYISGGDPRETTVTSTWTDADTRRALDIWEGYQRQHDVSCRTGQAVGIDPASGQVWFGESAKDIWAQMDARGVSAPLFYLRVGCDYYLRKGRRR
jgi:cobalt/nickel transport system permease protein